MHDLISRWLAGLPWPPGFFWPGCPCCGGGQVGDFLAGFNGSSQKDDDQYDPDTWTSLSDMPAATTQLGAGVVNNEIFAFGGVFDRLDTWKRAAGVWSSVADLPSPGRHRHAGYAIGDYCYAQCGFNVTSGQHLKDNDRYDPGGDSWAGKTDAPTPVRDFPAGCVLGTKGYLFGGTAGPPPTSYMADNDEYDPSGDSWAARADLPSPGRTIAAAAAIDGMGYCTGGQTAGVTYMRDTDEYDPGGDSWASMTDMPSPARGLHAATTIDAALYAMGGFNGTSYMTDNDEYVVDTWASRSDLPAPARNGAAAVTL